MKAVKFSKQAATAIVSFALLTPLAVTPAQAAGVPVIDVSAIAQAVTQVNNQVQQIKQLDQQIKAITDNGNFADILQDPTLRREINKYLPPGYSDILQAVQKGDAGALQGIYQQVIADEKKRQSSMTGAERVKMTGAVAEAQMIGMMKTLDVRSQSVQSLVNQINRTQNTAQKQDLMNTLQAQQAQINIDLNRMQVMMKMMERQERLAERQQGRDIAKKIHR